MLPHYARSSPFLEARIATRFGSADAGMRVLKPSAQGLRLLDIVDRRMSNASEPLEQQAPDLVSE